MYYPIGTVVLLQGGTHPIMIFGRKQIQVSTDKEWDYVACLYPEGNLGEDYNIFFNQEEIAQVLYYGWVSEYEQQMQQMLQQA